MQTPPSEDRSRERWKQARWAAAANVASRLMGMLVVVASVRLTLPYLGDARFGAWMMLASLTAMLSFLDLGVGNALTNRVAAAAAEKDPHRLTRTVSSGLLIVGLIATVMAALLAMIAIWAPWGWLLRTSDAALIVEARRAALVFALLFGVSVFSAATQKVFLGLQRSFEAHLASAVSSAVVLGLLFEASSRLAGIAVLLATTAVGQGLTCAVLLMRLAVQGRLSGTAALAGVRVEAGPLLRTGGLFLALQVGSMVGWGADSLIVSTTLGSAQVAIYAVVQRLFMFASLPPAMLNQPLWGAYADAHACGDRAFIARTLRRSLAYTALGVSGLAMLLSLFHRPLIDAWTQGSLAVPLAFVAAFAVWTVLEGMATCASMYLNGCNVVKPQVAAVVTFCAISIPLKVLLAQSWGLTGVVLCTILSYLVAVPLLYALFFRREILAPLRSKPDEFTH